jgi:hypothetical protein
MLRFAIAFATLAIATPTFAETSNTYTKLDFDDKGVCKNLTPPPEEGEPNDGAVLECRGVGANIVSFMEGDLRSFVSFGTKPAEHCSRFQTFGGFNSTGDTIEWRLRDGKAFATILRWNVSYDPADSSKIKSWLVVTKLEDNNSCHMGYVEAGYPKANETAQRLADQFAADFSCKTAKPIFIAKIGTETDGIAANSGCQPQ